MQNRLPSLFTRAFTKSLESWPHMHLFKSSGSLQFRLLPGRMDVAKAKIMKETEAGMLS